MNNRNWSIRSRIIALTAVPLSALLALWTFATVLTIGPAFNLLSVRTLLDTIKNPGETLLAELQQERRMSVVYLSAGGDGTALGAQRNRTDIAATEFRRAATSDAAQDAASEVLRTRINQLFTSLEVLPSGRGFIDRRDVDATGALGLYTGVIESAFRMFHATATFNHPDIDRDVRALTSLGRAREQLSQADAVLAGAFARGRFEVDEYARLVQIIGTQRHLYAESVAELPDRERTAYQELTLSDDVLRLREMQDAILASGQPGTSVPVSAKQWAASYKSAIPKLLAFETAAIEALTTRTDPVARDILLRLGLAGLLGLVALVISVLVAVWVGRSLVSRLAGLRGAALTMAGERLPDVVRRLRRGEDVDVAAETPPLHYGTDEIGQLGHAFTEVQRTAVQSAVDEARVRRGMNDVFLNIARRSQTLLHRQLSLLDRMERRVVDPQELEDLYRVDHLATRMRRHAEDLVILAGATPGRGWRQPVPMVDVIRGAISEVEDYRRVDVGAVASMSLLGRAVGDIIHLLAELLENAASFSPPHTRVQVSGQAVPNGYTVEVEDRGLGMTPEAIAEANARLLQPPQFDPADSARLGLFVVAQLSARHNVRVQLRQSPYGGVTAVALIPSTLVLPGGGPAALTAGPVAAAPDPAGGPSRIAPVHQASDAGPPGGDQPRPVTGSEQVAEPVAAVATGPDGLAQRRRTVARRSTVAGASPEPAETSAPDRLLSATVLPPKVLRPAAVPPPAVADPGTAGPPVPRLPLSRTAPTPTEDGLPKRVRQASLAPQLRQPAADASSAGAGSGATRSPDQVRSMMSALQAGTRRGRAAAVDSPHPPADGSALRPDGSAARPPAEVMTGIHLSIGDDRPKQPGDETGAHRQTEPDGAAATPGPGDGRPVGPVQGDGRPVGPAVDDWFTPPPPAADGVDWAEVATADYPLAGSAPPAADNVVHHGEIVPRQPIGPDADAGPPWSTVMFSQNPAQAGANDQPDKDA